MEFQFLFHVCNTSPHKFIFQRIFFIEKKSPLISQGTSPVIRRVVVWTYPWVLELFCIFKFLKDLNKNYHSISVKKRNRNSHEKWKIVHLSTLFIYRVSGAYCGFNSLLSKIEGIYAFNARLWSKYGKQAWKFSSITSLSQVSQLLSNITRQRIGQGWGTNPHPQVLSDQLIQILSKN